MADPATGYPLTVPQKESLFDENGDPYWFTVDNYFGPVQDINGVWFIFEREVLECTNPMFTSWVPFLESGEYVPPAE
jgi:hypothetical protein